MDSSCPVIVPAAGGVQLSGAHGIAGEKENGGGRGRGGRGKKKNTRKVKARDGERPGCKKMSTPEG